MSHGERDSRHDSDRPPHRDEAVRINKLADCANVLVVIFTVVVIGYLILRSFL